MLLLDKGGIIPFILLFYYTDCRLVDTYVTEGTLNKTITVEVNKSLEYIIDYNNGNGKLEILYPLRIHVDSENSHSNSPVIVVIRGKKEVLSWELPLIVEGDSGRLKYRNSARTLCYDGAGTNVNTTELYYAAINDRPLPHKIQLPYVTISTMSEVNVTANIVLDMQDDFYIKPSEEYTVELSPSAPKYYYYNFPVNNSQSKYVKLEIYSEDDICMTASIQNYSCPVMDLNDDITFRGMWQTMSRKGGITIPKWKFNYGFFIVFVVKGDDFACNDDMLSNTNRMKKITFKVIPTLNENGYFNAVTVTLACIVAFYFTFTISLFVCNRRCYVPRTMAFVNASEAVTPTNFNDIAENDDTVDDTQSCEETNLTHSIYVSHLSRLDQLDLLRKSYSYFWHVLTVALFYALPVIQLVITYQGVLNNTGNQDICYYNFFCANPLGFFSDFNHIFSNIGYISLGILFMIITYRRELWHNDTTFDENYGVPRHYGLFYAIGFALVMEGILSGSYHVCPNHSNFQFDTSFMYITAVLCMIKLYHTRHPDINASAYSTFGVLAIAILLGMIGILEPTLAFWIFFTIIHIIICFYLTVKIYYFSNCNIDRQILSRAWTIILQDYRSGGLNVFKPNYKSRMVLLLIGNMLNWALAACGIYFQSDFAIYLLGLFMLNTVYYFVFYIIMKRIHKERINCLTVVFLVLSLTCAVVSMYCFFNKSISWSKTPAQSRTYNKDCVLMGFYDYHDIWHFLSAVGMFFMFMVLLTLDDDLSHKPRSEIPVF